MDSASASNTSLPLPSSASSTRSISRRSPFPAPLRKASRATLSDAGLSRVVAQPQLETAGSKAAESVMQGYSKQLGDMLHDVHSKDTLSNTSLRGGQNTAGPSSNADYSTTMSQDDSAVSIASPSSKSGHGASRPNGQLKGRTASVGWLSLRSSPQHDTTARKPLGQQQRRSSSRKESLASSVETIRPAVARASTSAGESAVLDISSPIAESSSSVVLFGSPKQASLSLPPVPTPSAPPPPSITIPNSTSEFASVSSGPASGTTTPSPAPSTSSRSKWFSSIRRASSPSRSNSASLTSSTLTIRPLPSTQNTTVNDPPKRSPPIRPTIPSFTPPATPPNGPTTMPTPTPSTVSKPPASIEEPSTTLSGVQAIASSSQTVASNAPEARTATTGATSVPKTAPMASPVGRGWFGGSKASLVSRNVSPSPKGKEREQEPPVEAEAPPIPTENQTPHPVLVHDIPPPTPSIPILIPDTKPISVSAPVSARATPVTRGWFGSSKVSLAGDGSTPTVEVKENTGDDVKQPVPAPKIHQDPPSSSGPSHPSELSQDASPSPAPAESLAPTPATLTQAVSPVAARFTLGLPLFGRAPKTDGGIKGGSVKDTTPGAVTASAILRDVMSDVGAIPNGVTPLNPSTSTDSEPAMAIVTPSSTSAGPTLASGISSIGLPPPEPSSSTSISASDAPASQVPRDSPSATGDLQSEDKRDEVDPATSSSPPHPSSTWWNYLGLGGGPTSWPPPVNVVQTPATEPAPSIDTESGRRSPTRSVSSTASTKVFNGQTTVRRATNPPPPSAPSPPSADRENTELEKEVVVPATEAGPDRARSVTSDSAASGGWIAPIWAWAYSGPTSSGTNEIPDAGSKDDDATPKTEAELVKEEALRDNAPMPREDLPPPLPPQLETPPGPPNAEEEPQTRSNPVVVHAPTKSWMTFFSSKNNLATKKLTDGGVDESGGNVMEVMDIPDDVEGQPTTTRKPMVKMVVNNSSGGSSDDRGRARRDSTDSNKTPAPPLTNSDTIKRKVSTKAAPPSPSNRSIASRTASPAGGPKKERRANFVLPTFGDTFYTLPRVMTPQRSSQPQQLPASQSQRSLSRRAGAGLTKRTISFVASLLGPTETRPTPSPTASQKEHRPTDEMIQYLEERRERIARTWLGKTGSAPASTLSSPSTASIASTSTEPTTSRNGATLTMASSSASEHPVHATSVLGVTSQTVPMGRIAHKGHHHLNNGHFNTVSATTAAKNIGKDLPRIWDVLEDSPGGLGDLTNTKRIVVIGVHGWFPGAMIRTMLGEPTGTSSRLASMMGASVEEYAEKHKLPLEKLTLINLEGEGTIARRVAKLYQDLLDHPEWVEDVQQADVIFIATHSQGSIVSTQLIAALIEDGHIRTESNRDAVLEAAEISQTVPPSHPTRCSVLAMCGIHLGPLLYLNTSSLTQPYFTYFETAAARELFEFQDTNSEVSQRYAKALGVALDHGVKFLYIASLDDQVVPIYSGTFMTASHPLIMRALFIDGDAYSASDFIANLIVLLLRIRNAGLDDSGLITHLSEATAGSLSGVGHSTPYLNNGCYDLAVRFLFETSGVLGAEKPELRIEPFQARATRNDYEIPWALRGVISDPAILSLFASEIAELRQAFDDWVPKTSILKDLRRKLEPIQSLRILPPSPLALHSSHQDREVEPGVQTNSKL